VGSVRQVVDDGGSVALARVYSPYGESAYNTGIAQTDYGFTGEFTDPSGLIHLRARYYAPGDGRFISRDSWVGDYNRPLSLNRWNYVEGNPVNFTDPSGNITEKESRRAELILDKLDTIYNVHINQDWGYLNEFFDYPNIYIDPSTTLWNCTWLEGNWRSLDELEWTLQAVKDFTKAFGPQKGLFNTAMRWQPVHIYRIPTKYTFKHGAWTTIGGNVLLPNDVFDSPSRDIWAKGQIVHELAHVMDYRHWSRFSNEMASKTKSFRKVCYQNPRGVQFCQLVYDQLGQTEEPPTGYAKNSPHEDWAESFKVYIYPSMGNLRPIRRDYIKDVIWDLKTP